MNLQVAQGFPPGTNPRMKVTAVNVGQLKDNMRGLMDSTGFVLVPASHVGKCPAPVWNLLWNGQHPTLKMVSYEDELDGQIQAMTFELFNEGQANDVYMVPRFCIACQNYISPEC